MMLKFTTNSVLLLLFLFTITIIISPQTPYCCHGYNTGIQAAFIGRLSARTTTTTRLLKLGSTSSMNGDIDTPDEKVEEEGYKLIQKEQYDIVQVELENNRDYPIYIGTGFQNDSTDPITQDQNHPDSTITQSIFLEHMQKKQKILFITNDVVDSYGYLQHYTNILKNANENNSNSNPKQQIYTLILPDGEKNKDMDNLNKILNKCLEIQLDRQSILVALGGGVIGDMVGFAAAIYVRGIQFIQIPTTVMSMVDSSVGGKTGINHPLGKNMIGAFHQPDCVYIDINTLQTLPDRELYSGISEIIKYGLIRDTEFFIWLEDNMNELVNRNATIMKYAITRSCQNKAVVVKLDEKENNNIRATLNLGHTFGHAIETGCGYGTYLHGEAVAIGIHMAALLSYKHNWITQNTFERIVQLLQRAKLPTTLPSTSPMNIELFESLMSVDKKVSNGILRLILLKGDIGNCIFTADYDPNLLKEVIHEFVQHTDGTKQLLLASASNPELQQVTK